MKNKKLTYSQIQKKGKHKALMIDLDGTTVVYAREALPTQRVNQAIQKAKKYLHIGIATSRTYFESKAILDELMLTGPSVVAGGAHIIDAETRKTLWEERIDEKSVKEITSVFKQFKLDVYFNDEETGETIAVKHNNLSKNPLSLWAPGVHPRVADKMVEKLSDIPTIAAHKVKAWIEGKYAIAINSLKATKQHGVMKVAKMLNISTKSMIGVGDSYNDFPLLMACGLKIAMKNATPELKEIAHFVAPSVDEDGLATVIDKFVLEK